MKIVALTTSHNRRDLTVNSIKSLIEQNLKNDCSIHICLVDDGSTDGTGETITLHYNDVKVLSGDGDLYWAGGMRYGWNNYVSQLDFDYLLVFNDDVELFSDAIQALLDTASSVKNSCNDMFAITGAFKAPDTGEIAYGGLKRSSNWHPLRFEKIHPMNTLQDCDTLNMNLALISKEAINRIGFLSDGFHHAKADYDFGLRLRKAGGRVILAPGFMGECSNNPKAGTSADENLSFRERWHRLTSIKEQSPRERALFYRRHAGLFWPIFWLLPYLRVGVTGVLSSILVTKKPVK